MIRDSRKRLPEGKGAVIIYGWGVQIGGGNFSASKWRGQNFSAGLLSGAQF